MTDRSTMRADALLKPCPNPNDTGDGLDHANDHGETPCPHAPADEHQMHCEHWYDGEPCHWCGDPGLPTCPTCGGTGEVAGESSPNTGPKE